MSSPAMACLPAPPTCIAIAWFRFIHAIACLRQHVQGITLDEIVRTPQTLRQFLITAAGSRTRERSASQVPAGPPFSPT